MYTIWRRGIVRASFRHCSLHLTGGNVEAF